MVLCAALQCVNMTARIVLLTGRVNPLVLFHKVNVPESQETSHRYAYNIRLLPQIPPTLSSSLHYTKSYRASAVYP
jgi:hypothetical protein